MKNVQNVIVKNLTLNLTLQALVQLLLLLLLSTKMIKVTGDVKSRLQGHLTVSDSVTVQTSVKHIVSCQENYDGTVLYELLIRVCIILATTVCGIQIQIQVD